MASLARVKGIKGCSASAAATCPGGQNLEDNLKNLGAKVQGIAPVHGFQGEPDVSPRFTAFHEGFEALANALPGQINSHEARGFTQQIHGS